LFCFQSAFYGREVLVADRELVENDAERLLLEPAREQDIALLVVGDPFGATTHTDLVTRCMDMGIRCEVVHNASIINAVGCCGLQLYNFGRVVSIVFFTETWRPDSFYAKIKQNADIGLHTLCLLGLEKTKIKKQTKQKNDFESLNLPHSLLPPTSLSFIFLFFFVSSHAVAARHQGQGAEF
jgi:diphthine synthase